MRRQTQHEDVALLALMRPALRTTQRPPPPASGLAAVALTATTLAARAALASPVDATTLVVDAARLIPDGTEPALIRRIQAVEAHGGPRVRIATLLDGNSASPSNDELRAAWRPDARTLVLLADPGAPNMLRVYGGTGARASASFTAELVGRYGNMFARRADDGDGAALASALDVLLTCVDPSLTPDPRGCTVVPGVENDQRTLCAVFAGVGGCVAGFASRLRSPPFEGTPWVWLLLFAPLWATLLFSFGMGPLVVRGASPGDLAVPVAAFTAAGALFRASPLFAPAAFGADRDVLTREGRERIESDDEE